MNIPDYVHAKFNDEDGDVSSQWILFFAQLISELQRNLSNEGYVLPQQPTTTIAKLTDADKSTGAMIYDSTTNEFKVNIAGTWKVVTVT